MRATAITAIMRIFVINLARAAERREAMRQRLASLGLAFEILEATDGRGLTDAQRSMADDASRRRHASRPLTDNEIACFISHRRAMDALVASGAAMAAVLEDDVALAPELPEVLEAISGQAGRFDVIDLHRSCKRREFFVPCRPLLPGVSLGRVGWVHMGAQGYVVSRGGASRFLHQTARFADELDRELHRHWVNGLDIYGLDRPVVSHADAGVSLIQETRGVSLDYPEAAALGPRLRRVGARLSDSVRKRISFRRSVRQGRRAVF